IPRTNHFPYIDHQISLLTTTILEQVLDQYECINKQIKWTNDILINNKKDSGILTEMQEEQDKVSYVIIGIGINVNQKLSSYPKDLQSKVTSLNIKKKEKKDKTKLI